MFTEFDRLAMWNLRRESQMYSTSFRQQLRVKIMTPVDINEIEIAQDTCAEQPQAKGCPYCKELCDLIMEDEGLEPATTAEEALQLYLDLLDHINAIP